MIGPSSVPELKMTGANLRRLVPDIAWYPTSPSATRTSLCVAGPLPAVRSAVREARLPRKRLHEEAFAF